MREFTACPQGDDKVHLWWLSKSNTTWHLRTHACQETGVCCSISYKQMSSAKAPSCLSLVWENRDVRKGKQFPPWSICPWAYSSCLQTWERTSDHHSGRSSGAVRLKCMRKSWKIFLWRKKKAVHQLEWMIREKSFFSPHSSGNISGSSLGKLHPIWLPEPDGCLQQSWLMTSLQTAACLRESPLGLLNTWGTSHKTGISASHLPQEHIQAEIPEQGPRRPSQILLTLALTFKAAV